ncbi:MAG: FAD-dependent oxidoreductase [Peptococcaceae bacterium]|jgi:glycerol-3-phosphate dehydrogenase|nr:FAD-dependent oxidoreductase [Peptococcaceae bacterium]MDH7524865.1 FAD-dependent oxidoreductase [Peptococcaceae bacterium]
MLEVKGSYDVIVIGGGIAGAAALRELSKYKLSMAMLEKEAEVCFGQTKGTHGVIHCGFPGFRSVTPLRNIGEIKGSIMMEELCRQLDVPYKRVGKLFVAFDDEDISILREYEYNAKRNGVQGVEFIADRDRIRQMEPNISPEIIAALYTPTTAVTSPWGLVHGLVENALDNGAHLFVDTEVQAVETLSGGDMLLRTGNGIFQARYVINAAGLYADKVANMAGDFSFKISGTRQQRIIMDKKAEGIVRHFVRDLRKSGDGGDFVSPTVYGDIMVGSKVETIEELGDNRTTREGLEEWVIPRYLRLVPSLSPSMSIKPFGGFIPKAGNDYHIKPAPGNHRFINMVLGAQGLTASPAMGEYVVQVVLSSVGLNLELKKDFNPYRKGIPHICEMDDEEKVKLLAKDPRYGHIVCRCEYVSEGEIVEAIRRGARTRDGVKFRTRSGMGRCQGGFCGPRVLKILSRELGIPLEQVTRRGKGSVEVPYRLKELLIDEGKGDA